MMPLTADPFPPYVRPDPTALDTIANMLLIGGVIGAAVFAVAYFVLFRWYETAAGRQVLALVGSLLLVLALNVVARLTGGDYPGRDVFRLIAYGLVAVSSWGLVVILAAAWFRGGPALDLRERESVKRTPTKETPVTDLTPDDDTEDYREDPHDPSDFGDDGAIVWQPIDERTLNVVEVADLGSGGKLVAENMGVPTQVANPIRSTVRTVVAVLVGLVLALPTVNAVLLAVQAELASSGVELPAWVTVAVNGAIAGVALVSGIVTRVLAIPGVNAWLGQHALTRGLTAIPLQKSTGTLDPIY